MQNINQCLYFTGSQKREANTQFESYLEANFRSVFTLCEPNFKLSLLLDVKN